MSTNFSACPFDLRWYWGVVMWSTWYVLQKSLNSLDVNCLALSVTTQSTTPKRANSSCKNPIMQLVVGLLHCKPCWVAIHNNKVLNIVYGPCKIHMESLPWMVCFWPWFARRSWRFCCKHVSLARFYHVCYVPVHV